MKTKNKMLLLACGAALAAGAVPAPWTPVEARDGAVSVWGREYVWENSLLPVSIRTAGEVNTRE